MLAMIAVSRELGNTLFGELSFIQTTVNAFSVLAICGLGVTAAKFTAAARVSSPDKVIVVISTVQSLSIFASLLGVALYIISAPMLRSRGYQHPLPLAIFSASACVLFLGSIDAIQQGILSGLEEFKLSSWTQFVQGLIAFPLMIGGGHALGLLGVLLGQLTSAAAGCVLNYFAIKTVCRTQYFSYSFSPRTKEAYAIGSFAIPALLANLPAAPSFWLANAALANRDGGLAEVGLFGVAYQWRMALTLVISIGSRLSMPILASLHAKNPSEHLRTARQGLFAVGGVSAILALASVMFSSSIVQLYGFNSANTSAFSWVVLSGLISAINATLTTILTSTSRIWITVLSTGVWSLTLVSLAMRLIPARGAEGLGISLFVAESGVALCYLVYIVTLKSEKQPHSEVGLLAKL